MTTTTRPKPACLVCGKPASRAALKQGVRACDPCHRAGIDRWLAFLAKVPEALCRQITLQE